MKGRPAWSVGAFWSQKCDRFPMLRYAQRTLKISKASSPLSKWHKLPVGPYRLVDLDENPQVPLRLGWNLVPSTWLGSKTERAPCPSQPVASKIPGALMPWITGTTRFNSSSKGTSEAPGDRLAPQLPLACSLLQTWGFNQWLSRITYNYINNIV